MKQFSFADWLAFSSRGYNVLVLCYFLTLLYRSSGEKNVIAGQVSNSKYIRSKRRVPELKSNTTKVVFYFAY